MTNLFQKIPLNLSEQPTEFVETLAENRSIRIERIVSAGHASAGDFWYDQDQHEWVVVLSGEAQLLFADRSEPVPMRPGDYIHIPAHTRHKVHWTTPHEPTVWLAVFYDAV